MTEEKVGLAIIIIAWGFGLLFGLIISYYLIRAASGAATREKQLNLQNRILLNIALKIGVDPDRVKEMDRINKNISVEPDLES